MATGKIEYVADFETGTDILINKWLDKGDIKEYSTNTWAQCLLNRETKEIELFNDINKFMERMNDKKNKKVAFHNLRFDGSYIESYLLSNNFKHIKEEQEKENNTFTTVISDLGQYYSIKVFFKVKKEKRKGRIVKNTISSVEFWDSAKLIPMKVEDMKSAFELEVGKLEVPKGFYDWYRKPIGHRLTSLEKEYIINDCLTVGYTLDKMEENEMIKSTLSANALNQWKESLVDESITDPKIRKRRIEEKLFSICPQLSQEHEERMRKSYKGGWTHLKQDKRQTVNKGICLDVCSLYPSVMWDNPMPVGMPLLTDGEYRTTNNKKVVTPQHFKDKLDEIRPLKICCCFVSCRLKKGYLPSLMANKFLRNGDTQIVKTDGVQEFWLTNIDIELLFEHYHIDYFHIKYIYHFYSNRDLFKNYIDKYRKMKEENSVQKDKDGNIIKEENSALRTLAKLMLNSLYGKFGNNLLKANKCPYMSDDGIVKYITTDKEMTEGFSYVPIASFITSYARAYTIRSAQANYKRFNYGDTDSLFLSGWELPKNISIGDELGKWKLEYKFIDGDFIKSKTYALKEVKQKDGLISYKDKIKCAGMSDDLRKLISYDEFTNGTTENKIFKTKKLKTIKGGKIVIEQEFKIKMDKSKNFDYYVLINEESESIFDESYM